jgi:hypothetical protein
MLVFACVCGRISKMKPFAGSVVYDDSYLDKPFVRRGVGVSYIKIMR